MDEKGGVDKPDTDTVTGTSQRKQTIEKDLVQTNGWRVSYSRHFVYDNAL